MTGDVAQRIALVGYGNAFLAGLTERPPDLFSKHSAFKHDRSIEFRTQGRSIHRVDRWFAALARRGVRRLWLRTEDIAAERGGVWEVWIPSSVLITQRFERDRWRAVDRLLARGIEGCWTRRRRGWSGLTVHGGCTTTGSRASRSQDGDRRSKRHGRHLSTS